MKLHATYWGKDIDPELDGKIKNVLYKIGFDCYASGYDLTEERRDLCFETRSTPDDSSDSRDPLLTFRLPQEVLDGLDSLVTNGEAENLSDAARKVMFGSLSMSKDKDGGKYGTEKRCL